MSMQTRWTGKESVDAIADVRQRCYGTSPGEKASFLSRTQHDRFGDGDVLIAEQAGRAIGTATHLPLHIWVRGGRLPCQGVAWVGTVKSHRRRRVDGQGVASAIMSRIIDRARERGDVVSALMPFRASFYEHFGYGVVERQNIWTVPLAILPGAESDGFIEATEADAPAMAECRTRQTAAGQCDVDGGIDAIRYWQKEMETSAFTFIDRPDPTGPVRGFVHLASAVENGQAIAVIEEPAYDSPQSLARVLNFLGSLKDQYSAARLILPADLPLQWLLKERQVPHRRVDHPAATCNAITRMQLRILDHAKFLDVLHLPSGVAGKAVVSVQESEGGESRFALEVAAGRATGKTSTLDPQVQMKDHVWAAIATGALKADTAREMGLLNADDATLGLLDVFAAGPAPFTWEYF